MKGLKGDNVTVRKEVTLPLRWTRGSCAVLAVVVVAFWLAAATAGFPRAFYDDSIMIGPSLSILQEGKLTNYLLSDRFYPREQYLFYPPVFSWVLSGWMYLFSTSSASLAAFWAACCVFASAGLGILLARLTRSIWLSLAAPILLFGCEAYLGFRLEVLGFASFFTGLVFATSGGQRWRLAGYALLFATPTVAPTFLAYAGSSIAALLLYNRRAGSGEIMRAATGLLLAVAILALTTQGNLLGLVETMSRFQSVRIGAGGRSGIMEGYIRPYILFSVLLIVSTCARALVCERRWSSVNGVVGLILIAAYPIMLLTHARESLVVAFRVAAVSLAIIDAAAIGGSLLSSRSGRPRATKEFLTLAGFACFALFLVVVNYKFNATYAVKPLNQQTQRQIARIAERVSSTGLIVADPRVAMALEYKPTGRIQDSMVRNAWPDIFQDFHAIPKHEVWIITRANFAHLLAEPLPKVPRMQRFFIASGTFPYGRKPDDICVLTRQRYVQEAEPSERAMDRLCKVGG